MRCFLNFFGDTLILTTSCIGWCHLNFDSSLIVQSNAIQLYILTNRTTAFRVCSVFDTSRFGKLNAYKSVENMIPYVTYAGCLKMLVYN